VSSQPSIPIFSVSDGFNLEVEALEFYQAISQPQASIAPKYFYSTLGSRLFDAITLLDEYYPCLTEKLIFDRSEDSLKAHLPQKALFIDLGAGDCAKASPLLGTFKSVAYLAIDISVTHLSRALRVLGQDNPSVTVAGLGCDFSKELKLPAEVQQWLTANQVNHSPRIVFYPGSSIGNFSPKNALSFLKQVHAICADGGKGSGLLIGVDRVKDLALLQAAYDDSLGVTAAFNRSILAHVNERFATNFSPSNWSHQAFFNASQSRIEMHLKSTDQQLVRWPGGERLFVPGQTIHTENSYKWEPGSFTKLLTDAGFSQAEHFTDPQGWFSLFWAKA
jgi:L-histidine N-alpha-methyltransferase